MRKNLSSILVLALTVLLPLAGSAGIYTRQTDCSFLKDDQLCVSDGRRTECGPRPEEYTLSTSIEQSIDDMFCVEKTWTIVTKQGVSRKTGNACGPLNSVDFVRKNIHLFCAPVGNEESGMRIGN